MLIAHKSPWFSQWFSAYVQKLLHRNFSKIEILGLAQARHVCNTAPTLWILNHVSYWDGLVVLWLVTRVLPLDAYVWMDGHNLQRVAFFRWVGAFGVRPDAAWDVGAGVKYALGKLQQPLQMVGLFPQGRERPASLRPLQFYGGSALIMRRAGTARMLPVALRYEFCAHPKPELHVAFGEPFAGSHTKENHEAAMVTTLALQATEITHPSGAAERYWTAPPCRESWPSRLLSLLANRCMQSPLSIKNQGSIAPTQRPLAPEAQKSQPHDDIAP